MNRSVFKIYFTFVQHKNTILLEMPIPKLFIIIIFVAISTTNSLSQNIVQITNITKTINDIKVGADRTDAYLPLLIGKSVALVTNQSSTIKKTHLVDSLLSDRKSVV